MQTSAVFLFSSLVCSIATGQAVLTVGAGAAFADIQFAADVAQPGDTILVRPGTYAGATIGVPVSLVADGPGVFVNTLLSFTGLPAGTTTLIDGITNVREIPTTLLLGLMLTDCDGSVWVQDCSFLSGSIGDPIEISGCPAVTLQRVHSQPASAHFGASIFNSAVSLFECTVDGGQFMLPDDDHGRAGMRLLNSEVDIHDSTITGGTGFAPTLFCFANSSRMGGPGILTLGNSTVRVFNSVVQGGPPGMPCGGGAVAAQGLPTELDPLSIYASTTGPSHRLVADRVAREGGTVDYTVTGPAGNLTALAFSLGVTPV